MPKMTLSWTMVLIKVLFAFQADRPQYIANGPAAGA